MPNIHTSKVFSMQGYTENQTFKRLKESDPSFYKLVRDKMLNELQLLSS